MSIVWTGVNVENVTPVSVCESLSMSESVCVCVCVHAKIFGYFYLETF